MENFLSFFLTFQKEFPSPFFICSNFLFRRFPPDQYTRALSRGWKSGKKLPTHSNLSDIKARKIRKKEEKNVKRIFLLLKFSIQSLKTRQSTQDSHNSDKQKMMMKKMWKVHEAENTFFRKKTWKIPSFLLFVHFSPSLEHCVD